MSLNTEYPAGRRFPTASLPVLGTTRLLSLLDYYSFVLSFFPFFEPAPALGNNLMIEAIDGFFT
jgi:hypothetical protein